jgi:hypothetical protein
MAESRNVKAAESKDVKDAEKGAQQVQQAVDRETEQGFRGVKVDQTDDHAYTVAGVVAGEPVPEAAADPVAARREATNTDVR